MKQRLPRHWSLLAVAVVVVALGVGGGANAGSHRFVVNNGAGISSQLTPTGALDAVMRTEVERIESAATDKSASVARLLLLLAAPLTGLALLLLHASPRRAPLRSGPPSCARLQRWVARRGPPSSQLVFLTS